MKRFVSRGVVFLAGAVALPMSAPILPAYAYVDRAQDPRLNILKRFFEALGCPASQYSSAFLEAADSFSLDWRLLPSLSYVESTGGKAAAGNNFFGWDSGRARFTSPVAAIRNVAERLSRGARYHGKTLEQKLAIYNPNPGYGAQVKRIMRRISPTE
ncbi:MAG TPA: hypothetical protein VMU19_06940 [Bryobacteraceae bacterium]|nr:hypothetical protein [Bryobacteraceae bacterium]